MWVYKPGCLFQNQILRVLLMEDGKLKFWSGYGNPGARCGKKMFMAETEVQQAMQAHAYLQAQNKSFRQKSYLHWSYISHFSEVHQGSDLYSCPLTSETFINCAHVSVSRLCQQDFSRTNSTEEFCRLVGIACLLSYSSSDIDGRHKKVVFTQILWGIWFSCQNQGRGTVFLVARSKLTAMGESVSLHWLYRLLVHAVTLIAPPPLIGHHTSTPCQHLEEQLHQTLCHTVPAS